MMKTGKNDADRSSEEQSASYSARLSTNPDEKVKLPTQNIIPDGVSTLTQHPLDPLNAGENQKNKYNISIHKECSIKEVSLMN